MSEILITAKNIKKNLIKKENIYYLLLVLTIFSLDRFSKEIIINNYSNNTYFINEYLNLDLIWNTGIGFGILSTDTNLLYNLITLVILIVILTLIYFITISSRADKFIYSIIIGGALGNFFDRLMFKAVPDFIDLHYNNFHWFTFNIADIFITIGILFFVFKEVFCR